MRSIILSSMIKALMPLMAVASVFLLLRGHDEPGGGFIGGLLLATGLVGYAVVFGPVAARTLLHVTPRMVVTIGLAIAVISGWIGWVIAGDPFLTSRGHWVTIHLTAESYLKIGPSLGFDIGVYLLVAGSVMTFVFHMMEADSGIEVRES